MATPIPHNVAAFSIDELASITGGQLLRRGADAVGRGVTTDSRRAKPGSIFVALEGAQFDGHAFVQEVAARGAAAVVVSREVEAPGASVVRVPDTLEALGALASHHVARLRQGALRTVIGVTGSVGKTTTKEMLALGLSAGRPQGAVRATEGNLNNRIGVPMTLLSLDEQAQIAVVEMGMNLPGEIEKLARIAAPDLGVVTAVAPAHTEGVGSLENVAKEKASLLRALGKNALGAIAPADDEAIEPFLDGIAPPLVRVGEAPTADVRVLERTTTWEGTQLFLALDPRFCAEPEARRFEVALPLFGRGAARNAAMTLAAAAVLGGLAEVRRATAALRQLTPTPGRLELVAGTQESWILDDSYNASPRAVENALETASELARASGGRVIAVLGDMLELGALELEYHARVGETAARLGVSLFVGCGPRMRAAAEEARELGCDFVLTEPDPELAVEPVRSFVRPRDVIVVKGSRGLRMERVVEGLKRSASSEPPASAPDGGEAAA